MGRKRAVIEVKSSQGAPAHFIDRLLALPRYARVLIAVIPALALTFIISPVVDEFYLRFFFSRQTAELPAWITAGFAIAAYFAGWYFLVGYAGEEPARRREIRWYVLFSGVVIILAFIWFVILSVLNISITAD
jgi:hypothetical protein